jgi:hypothetical protein
MNQVVGEGSGTTRDLLEREKNDFAFEAIKD